jgi:hypothetical protein
VKYKPTTIILTAVLLLGMYQGVRAGIESWSITAGSNNATPPDGAPENMAPSTVNNTMREMMAQTRKWAEQAVSGTWNADAGSANAYQITPEIVPTSLVSGQVFRFKAANTNTGDSYLQVGALSTITMVTLSNTALVAGDVTKDLIHTVVYDGTYMQLQPTTQAVANVNIVKDTTPQLGGFLDPNNHYIGITKGGDIASASPIVIDTDGDYFDVTGTTNFNTVTVSDARHFFLQFDEVLTLSTSTTLDLPGNATITTAAGDVAEVVSTATDTVRIVNYTKADGTPVVGGGEALHYQEQRTSGTTGPTYTAADWRTCPFNTEVVDTGANGAVSTNQITLQPGTYEHSVSVPFTGDSTLTTARLRLFDITNTAVISQGINSHARTSTAIASATLTLTARHVVATATVFEVQIFPTFSTTAGAAVSSGGVEVYTDWFIRKVK